MGNKTCEWGEDVQETTHYVTYAVAPQQKGGLRPVFPGVDGKEIYGLEPNHNQAIQDFMAAQQNARVLGVFVELPDTRRTAKWPQLQKALDLCKQNNATLLIPELGTLANNESFAHHLLAAGARFHCLDQPFVNQTILEALSKHAQVQRKLHGKLIREGLKMTSAKSGNPNAAEVISKVNKPKIDTAIVFAFLLQPIIHDYRRKGFSQRQMVKMLNDEGFTAPEGGKWVLSQLQKVLDRVRLNEIAMEHRTVLENEQKQNHSPQQIADLLNGKGVSSLKKGPWDESQIKKLQDRIEQIQDIACINRFVLNLLPILHELRRRSLSPLDMLKEFHQSSDKELKNRLETLKQDLKAFPKGNDSLAAQLESAAKHIPAYLKIVKGHISQLAQVLELETHEHRKLDSVGLAEPVTQLMQLFRELDEQDLQLIETLAYESRHWQPEYSQEPTKEATAA